MSDRLLDEAHHFLDWARENGAGLDLTDESVVFVQGVVESMAEQEDPRQLRAVKLLGYSVYLAELLAATCADVEVVVDGEGMRLDDVRAVRADGRTQFTLNWIYDCLDDPAVDNLLFKYAGALRDFGETERAREVRSWLDFPGGS